MKICKPLRRTACLIALSVCAATAASAAEKGFYLGANLGEATYDLDQSKLRVLPIVVDSSVEDSDWAYQLSFGYRFMKYIGVEVSLGDYGDLEAKETGFVTTTPAVGYFTDIEIGTRGAALSAVGTLPLGKFEIFGKAGVIKAETKFRVRQTATFGATGGVGGIAKEEKTTAIYGAGVGYTIGESLFVKLEYTMAPKVIEQDNEDIEIETDLNFLSFGFQYRF